MEIWDVKRRIKSRKQIQKQITNEKGERITDPKKILQEYKRYYEELLVTKEAKTEEEKTIEENVS